ncbi:MAG: DUF4129 domain-containing protein [Nocardioides sp.]
MRARGTAPVAVAAVLGCVLVVVALGSWAATVGPSGVVNGPGPTVHRIAPRPTSASASPTTEVMPGTTEPAPTGEETTAQRLVGALLRVLAVAVVVVVLGLALRLLLAAYAAWSLRRRPPPAAPPEVAFDVVETPRRLEGLLQAGATEQRALLEDGSPRNAIVACWARFEEQAGEAGLRRHSWETSAEFTLRVLDLVVTGSHAATVLAGLYREARFSDHPLTEEHRQEALAALDALHAELAAGPVVAP